MAKGKQRDGRREARWRRIIGEHERSGLGVRAFCRAKSLRESAFYFWRGEIQRRQAEHEHRRGDEPLAAPMFVPVHVAERSAAAGAVEILLADGCRVHVAAPVDRRALADVLAVLRSAAGVDVQEGDRC
jgi:hypothetical protein